MWKRLALTILATIALAFSPVATFAALADDSPVPAPTGAPSFRPPIGVLRGVSAPTASPVVARANTMPTKELVLFVGGYQTCSCSDDSFKDLAQGFDAAGFDTRQFGQDARYAYDTYGHIDANARDLRDEIRSLSSEYAAIHIVTHSMGGAVADQAFAQGLSAADGVATYISLAAPHAGSDAARATTLVNALGPSEVLHRLGSLAGFETQSEAVEDLATTRPVVAPVGVVRLDIRESTDIVVTGRDSRDPGVTARILKGSGLDGHGSILTDPAAIAMTLETVTARRVPPDERSQDVIDGAKRESDIIGTLAIAALFTLGAVLVLSQLTSRGRFMESILGNVLPRANRKHCP